MVGTESVVRQGVNERTASGRAYRLQLGLAPAPSRLRWCRFRAASASHSVFCTFLRGWRARVLGGHQLITQIVSVLCVKRKVKAEVKVI